MAPENVREHSLLRRSAAMACLFTAFGALFGAPMEEPLLSASRTVNPAFDNCQDENVNSSADIAYLQIARSFPGKQAKRAGRDGF
jgi:hypothetical protein